MKTTTSPLQTILEKLYFELKDNCDGQVATYIPELGKADPRSFGICLVTADGEVYEVGDCRTEFTIQSISKPFVYGIALEDQGREAVLNKIWMEPSGEAFNAISLRPDSGKPENPMINAGAITATSLVEGMSTQAKIDRILTILGKHAGRDLTIDQSVYQSESSTGHRNRAISYMLRNFDIFEEDPLASLEAYFMQCSIKVNCRDLGMMAATLANGGVNPQTGERAIAGHFVENLLSVMGSCGMYNAAGEWIYNVGMPAKSGVAGGIVAVLPGQLGIGVFSPPLDPCGNSVRGVEVCRRLSRDFNLHMFQVPRLSTSAIRRVDCLTHNRSSRMRSDPESKALKKCGDSVRVIELQGDLTFGTAEFACREFAKAEDGIRELIIDFSHVVGINPSAIRLFVMAIVAWVEAGRRLTVSRCERFPQLRKALSDEYPDLSKRVPFYSDMSAAFEAAENTLLDELGLRRHSSERVELRDCRLLRGVADTHLQILQEVLIPMEFSECDVLMRAGDPADCMYFLMRGKASVWIETEIGLERRIGTFSPSMNFGEIGLLNSSPRSAEIRADSDLQTLMLTTRAFESLETIAPALQRVIFKNLAEITFERLKESNAEIAQLHR